MATFTLWLGRAAGRAFGNIGRAGSVRPSTIFPGSVVHYFNGTNQRVFFCGEKKELPTRYVNVKSALNWLLRDFKKDGKPVREEVFECLVNPPEELMYTD